MKLYNTSSKKLEEFRPINEVVKVYTCGPTVYNFQHIGNYAAQIYWDLLVRALRANNYNVKRVLNLTDVGHLVSDGDEGEDKLEKGAAREGKSVWEIAEFYIEDFLRSYRALNLSEPEVIARATDYIKQDMRAVDKMTENGFTYETEDGVYYDTSKFTGYADFARLDLAGLQAGARIAFSDEKRNASDFAVWKFIKPGEKHEMRWDYLGRPGYPGWHLECSTIIHEELGEPIDIHTGGIDHIPIHHTNEIAQSFAISGRSLAKYWLHCDFITIDGQKISKSLGNVYLLDDLAERGFLAMDYKMWVLSGHYQGTRNFTFESLEAARNRRLNWRNRIAECYQKHTPDSKNHTPALENHTSDILGTYSKILEAVNHNLNSAEAFSLVDNLDLSFDDWKKVDELFGLKLIEDTPDISEELKELIREREAARAEKDFAKSDEIRDKLAFSGVAVKDTAEGSIWYYL
ncbi:MAG: cysteine--tRNA ligase [Candidatus Saccharibacteria bacterium]|nr:cysteine--tRNA ligase [Candidatus Saccharibacteria bacterium]